jgi:hypothetical protein
MRCIFRIARPNSQLIWTAVLQQDCEDRVGNDGAEWIIEGIKRGNYRLLSRWTPREGAIHELGLTFAFGLTRMSIPKDQVY